MTWRNRDEQLRKDIDDILNLICKICGKSYMTTFDLVEYCNSCIDKLEEEMEHIDE